MKSIIFWIWIPIGLIVGILALLKGNTFGGIFWIAIAVSFVYTTWKMRKQGLMTNNSIIPPPISKNQKIINIGITVIVVVLTVLALVIYQNNK